MEQIDEENKENETFDARVERGFTKLKNHKFFEGIDWNLIKEGKGDPPIWIPKKQSTPSFEIFSQSKNLSNYSENFEKKLDPKILDEILGISQSNLK